MQTYDEIDFHEIEGLINKALALRELPHSTKVYLPLEAYPGVSHKIELLSFGASPWLTRALVLAVQLRRQHHRSQGQHHQTPRRALGLHHAPLRQGRARHGQDPLQ